MPDNANTTRRVNATRIPAPETVSTSVSSSAVDAPPAGLAAPSRRRLLLRQRASTAAGTWSTTTQPAAGGNCERHAASALGPGSTSCSADTASADSRFPRTR